MGIVEVASLTAASAFAETGDKFDLVIKGGEVLDPSQRLRARSDLGIRNAMIAALERYRALVRLNGRLGALRTCRPFLEQVSFHSNAPSHRTAGDA